MEEILRAIVDDDPRAVGRLLKTDPGLATCSIRQPTLYKSGIFHWIYAGDTALHLASAGYRVEIARRLLAAGADPNAADNHRQSAPIHYAADGFSSCPAWDPNRQVAMLRCLVAAGANLHAQDKNGATPLHRAVRTRCARAVRFLLEAGADSTARNKPGSTPFHLAVQNTGRGGSGTDAAIRAQREIIEVFLSLGLEPGSRYGAKKSVRDSARSRWIQELLG